MAKHMKKEDKKGKAGRVITTIILLICIGACAVSGYFIYDYLHERHQNDVEYKQLKGKSYEDILKKNKDVVGWIEMEGTKISYPIMWTPKDGEYYLHRNMDKEYSISGALFVDERCNAYQGNHLIIFGHHMSDGTMFGELCNYSSDKFYKKHKTFKYTFIDKEGVGTTYVYRVFSYFKTETYAKPDYMEYAALASPDKFKEYIDFVKKKSEKDIDITPKWGDDLITLSTCSYHVARPYGRYVVVAVKDSEIKPEVEKIVHKSKDANYLDIILDNQLYMMIAIAAGSVIGIIILIALIKALLRMRKESDDDDDDDDDTEVQQV